MLLAQIQQKVRFFKTVERSLLALSFFSVVWKLLEEHSSTAFLDFNIKVLISKVNGHRIGNVNLVISGNIFFVHISPLELYIE